MKDKLGQDIQVGCYIAYGHALGRCAALKIGRVLKVATKPREAWDTTSSTDRITVVGVDDDMWHWDPERYPIKLSKIGTLQFPDRVIVLNPKLVPVEFKALMDAFEWTDK
jgi:uncharacterized protein YneR